MNTQLIGNNTVFFQLSENGQFESIEKLEINRAFLFGDGLFETMIFTSGHIRYKAAHLARLLEGCKALRMKYDDRQSLDNFEKFLQDNLNPDYSYRVRWNVYRSGLGKYTPELHETKELFSIQLFKYQSPEQKKAYISQSLKVPQLPWSNCKTLNALVYVMANEERKAKKYDEVILLNADGFVCETGIANVFWIRNDIYYTPSLRSSCIAGVGRQAILKKLEEQDIEVIKGEFKPKDILAAEQIFTSNVTGINYISMIDLREYDVSPIGFLEGLFS